MTGTIYPSVFLNLYLFLSASILLYIFSVFCLLFLHLLNTNFSQQAFSFPVPHHFSPVVFFFKLIIDFYFLEYKQVGNSFWQFINIFESSIRFAVPVFFMISGALLIKNLNESIKDFYKKRFLKVIANENSRHYCE